MGSKLKPLKQSQGQGYTKTLQFTSFNSGWAGLFVFHPPCRVAMSIGPAAGAKMLAACAVVTDPVS